MKKHILMTCVILFMVGCQSNKKAVDVSAKQDWTVPCDPSQAKAQNEYDVIVVGSGIGGLSAASLLATSGYKVLVLEQHSQVGGYCTSYSRDGYTFPVGAHDISGLDRGAIAILLEKLKLKKEDLFVLHTRTYVLGDKTISFTGTKNDVVQKLSEQFPKEKGALISFFNDAEQALNERRALRKDLTALCPTYENWEKVTYWQKLDEYFTDSEVKKFLCSLLGYIGTGPNETAASEALYACLSYFIYGGYYPKEGGKLFAESLKESIESHGGTIRTSAKVDEILVTNNSVTGVRSGERVFLSSLVVANANAKTVFFHLLPKGALDSSFLNAIGALKMSTFEAVVNFGVDLDLSSFSSIVKIYPRQMDGETCSFFISSNADPTTAPHGCASLSIGVDSLYSEVPPLGTPEYKAYKEKLAEEAIKKLEKVIPGLREHVVVKDVVTPRTYESFTSMPEGAYYAFDQSKGSKRPYFKTPIHGLYLASASTYPGAGVEAVVASGLICARDIMSARKTSEILLPTPSLESGVSVEEAIQERHSTRGFQEEAPVTLSDVSQLLWAAQGITHGKASRAAPSAGALYPLELYLVAEHVTGLLPGIYKYNVLGHSLEKRLEGHQLKRLCSQKSVERASAGIVIYAVYDREEKKYGAAAKTYTDIEVGCVAENVCLQAVSRDLGVVFVAGFDPQTIKEILGTPANEQPVCLLPFGQTKSP